MRRRTPALAATTLAVLALGATSLAAAGDDGEAPIPAEALDAATAAALEATGGGRVTDTEVGDEESHYEVEVTLDDGRQVDVQLDEAFAVIGTSADGESAADD